MPSLLKIIRNGHRNVKWEAPHHNLTLRKIYDIETARQLRSQPKENPEQEQQALPEQLLDEAKKKAESIISKASEQASLILEEARQQASAEAEQLKKAASSEGYEQGYRSAIESAKKEAEQIKKQARDVLARAEENRRKTIEGLRKEVFDLAVEIAEKILARELKSHPETVLSIAEEAIQLAGNRKHVVLWVHPSELEICNVHKDRLVSHLPPRSNLQIMADETVEPGGCVVENEYGRVDARLSTRWQNLLASLAEGAG